MHLPHVDQPVPALRKRLRAVVALEGFKPEVHAAYVAQQHCRVVAVADRTDPCVQLLRPDVGGLDLVVVSGWMVVSSVRKFEYFDF